MNDVANAETAPAEEIDKAESRRDTLSKGLDALETPADGQTETAEQKTERLRDEAGRFAKGEARPVLTAKPVAPVADAQPAQPSPWDAPPKSWKKESHELWGKTDAEIRKMVHEREEQMRAGVEGIIPKAKFADQVTQALGQHIPRMQALGIDTVQGIKGLAEADAKLRERDPQYALALLQGYGYDVQALFGAASQPADVVSLRQENATLKRNYEQLKAQTEERENAEIDAKIEAFKNDKPNFDALRPKMVRLLNAKLADTLDEAYDMARSLNPSLAPPAPQGQPAATPAAKHQAAQRARTAAVSVRGATPGTTTPTKAQSRRDKLAESFGELEGRL